jgi:pyroglutamyl-peptidase
MMKVLLTGFEPFDGETINPSLETVRAVAPLRFARAAVETMQLPVDRFRAPELTLSRIRAWRPDVVLMLGEARGRYRVTPERIAINVDDYVIPDNAGNQPRNQPIAANGPAGYFSTLPIHAIVDRLLAANIPAGVSNTAGTYLCNRIFYSVMHGLATEGLACRAGFVHVPAIHEQTLRKRGETPSLSRETIVEAARLAIEACVDE